jgi:hypothetical protein
MLLRAGRATASATMSTATFKPWGRRSKQERVQGRLDRPATQASGNRRCSCFGDFIFEPTWHLRLGRHGPAHRDTAHDRFAGRIRVK